MALPISRWFVLGVTSHVFSCDSRLDAFDRSLTVVPCLLAFAGLRQRTERSMATGSVKGKVTFNGKYAAFRL